MRRSKQDSLKTRRSIMVAARRVFARRGVSQTSMEHIAKAAGVTRGAVYGHFRDKVALFREMRDTVKVPLIDTIDEILLHDPKDPLAGVEHYLLKVISAMRDDAATRDTFRILIFKCEYVGEIEAEMQRQVERTAELVARLEAAYRVAAKLGRLRKGVTAHMAAIDTTAFLVGLIRLWLLDEGGKLARKNVARIVHTHVSNLRAGQR
jgi:TetR/AcrR family acrAB operon transcriptional repressor